MSHFSNRSQPQSNTSSESKTPLFNGTNGLLEAHFTNANSLMQAHAAIPRQHVPQSSPSSNPTPSGQEQFIPLHEPFLLHQKVAPQTLDYFSFHGTQAQSDSMMLPQPFHPSQSFLQHNDYQFHMQSTMFPMPQHHVIHSNLYNTVRDPSANLATSTSLQQDSLPREHDNWPSLQSYAFVGARNTWWSPSTSSSPSQSVPEIQNPADPIQSPAPKSNELNNSTFPCDLSLKLMQYQFKSPQFQFTDNFSALRKRKSPPNTLRKSSLIPPLDNVEKPRESYVYLSSSHGLPVTNNGCAKSRSSMTEKDVHVEMQAMINIQIARRKIKNDYDSRKQKYSDLLKRKSLLATGLKLAESDLKFLKRERQCILDLILELKQEFS